MGFLLQWRQNLLPALCLCLVLTPVARADGLLLGAAAGYKKPMEAVCTEFERESGLKLRRFYGNISQIVAQSARDGRVDVLVGDRAFLDKSGIAFSRRITLGQGRAVLAWRRGLHLQKLDQLATLRKVAMPDPKQAIYGRAAEEFLAHAALAPAAPPKVVGSMSQVVAYLVSGEVDAGFINLTEALALGDAIGGYLELPGESHTPILIEAAFPVREDAPDARNAAWVERFAGHLAASGTRSVLHGFGL